MTNLRRDPGFLPRFLVHSDLDPDQIRFFTTTKKNWSKIAKHLFSDVHEELPSYR
jgi:hypothetical protein